MRTRRRNSPDVAITRNDNEPLAISEGLGLIEADGLIDSNDVVVITPNWVNNKPPATGVIVGQDSFRRIIHFAKKNNPRRVVIATGSGGQDTSEIMRENGFDRIIEEEGVEYIDLNKGPFTRVKLNHNKPDSTYLNRIFEEMTFLISYTQLKIHEEAVVSAAIKNIAMGWPPAEEHGYPKKNLGIHDDLHGFIRAMAEIIPIDLSVVSANPAMVGTGPSKGIARHTGMVICGTDPVATDVIGARLLGFRTQAVHYLYQCANANIGIGDIENINIKGMPLTEAENTFSSIAYGSAFAVDGN